MGICIINIYITFTKEVKRRNKKQKASYYKSTLVVRAFIMSVYCIDYCELDKLGNDKRSPGENQTKKRKSV